MNDMRRFELVLIASLAVAAGILFYLLPSGDWQETIPTGDQTSATPVKHRNSRPAPGPQQEALPHPQPRSEPPPSPGVQTRPLASSKPGTRPSNKQTVSSRQTREPAPGITTRTPKPASNRVIDVWFSRYRGTAKIGWGHLTGTKLPDGYRMREDYRSRSASALTRKVYESSMSFVAEMDDNFVVRSIQLSTREAGRTTQVLVTRLKSRYTFRTRLEGRTTTKQLEVTHPVIGSNDLLFQRLYRQGRLRKGFTHTFRELLLGVPKENERTLRVVSEGTTGADGKQRGVVIAFGAYTAKLDTEGIVKELTAGNLRMVVESEASAKDLPVQAAIFQDKLRINTALPNYTLLDEVTMTLHVRGYKGMPIFKDNEYQTVYGQQDPSRYTLKLKPRRFSQTKFPELGYQVTQHKPFLEADAIRQSDASQIKRKALQIIGKERNSLRVVRKLAEWIHVNLKKQYTAVGNQTAITTLATMSGDCSEHALLFDSFARSLGIPVKQCSGYVFLGRAGGPHAWSQVWLGQEWIHVDCVLNSIGSDPRYILFWKQNATKEYDRTTWVRRGALSTHPVTSQISKLKLKTTELSISEARVLARLEGKQFGDPLIGIRLTLPAGWRAETTHTIGRITFRHQRGLHLTVRTWDTHPKLILKSRQHATSRKLKTGIGNKPTWKLEGWLPMYVVEHGAGSLLIQLGRHPRHADDQAHLQALLEAIQLESPEKR